MKRFAQLYDRLEIGGSGRNLPMEGLRGVAVLFVFMQHYCMQFISYGDLTGWTQSFAFLFRNIGNYGVELFFVLSGYLIYGILLRKRPPFLEFMLRRAQRLYPAFLVALFIGALLDIVRPEPNIPPDLFNGASYLLANLLFLPGLVPMEALFGVNWSLSYEWWFYATATLIFSTFRMAAAPAWLRVSFIAGCAATLVVLWAAGFPAVPIRGISLFAGMLLAEAERAGWRPVPGWLGLPAVLIALLLLGNFAIPMWIGAPLLSVSLYLFCSAAMGGRSAISAAMSWQHLRRFGNFSYSYYLIHAFFVLAAVRGMLFVAPHANSVLLFWIGLVPTFALTYLAGAVLFLTVERRFSLAHTVGRASTSVRPPSPAHTPTAASSWPGTQAPANDASPV